MSPDLNALLAAVRDDPEDRLSRLALADWCEEQREAGMRARGEAIRLQVEMEAARAPERAALRRRLREMQRRHRKVWMGSLRTFGHRCDFVLGGLLHTKVMGNHLGSHAIAPFSEAEWRWVFSAEVDDLTPAKLATLSRLLPARALSAVRFSGAVNTRVGISALMTCPLVACVRDLTLHFSGLCDDDLRALLAAPAFACIRALTLSASGMGKPGAVLLARELRAAQLKRLSLWSTALTAEDIGTLLVSPGFSRLTHLALSHSRSLGDGGAQVIAESRHCWNLVELDLQGCGLSDAGVMCLGRSPHLGRLQKLNVRLNHLTEATALALINNLPMLRTLLIDSGQFSREVRQALRPYRER